MRSFASRIDGVEYSATIELSDRIKQMQAEGQDVITMAAARPDFDTPDLVKEGAVSALRVPNEYTAYSESRGLLELREAVADKLRDENELDIDPEREILITVGAREAIFLALQVLVEPGDEVLVLDPSWLTYQAAIKLAGGIPVPIPLRPENDYRLDIDRMKSALTDSARVMVLNTPNNPTGVVFSRDEMRAIAETAMENDLVVITDEIYEHFLYDGSEHVTLATLPGMRERTVTTNACSKAWAMTGWRVGYGAGPADIIDRMLLVHQHLVSSPCAFAQKGAVLAFTEARENVKMMVQAYNRRRELLADGLARLPGIRFSLPEGACFFFPQFPGLDMDSRELSRQFLERGAIALTPGGAFGQEGEGHLRMSFASVNEKRIPDVLERIEKVLNELHS